MTFNEGIRIDTGTTSSRGGMSGRGMAVGGGVGGLVVVLIALFFGVDPGSLTGGQTGGQLPAGPSSGAVDYSHCKTGADANRDVVCRVIATGNSVDAVWKTQLKGYQAPKLVLFRDGVDTACGAATSAVGPFYCPGDRTVYIDTDFYDVLVEQFGSSAGPLAQEYVIAHEYGHHVQNLLGDIGKAQQGAQGATGNSVRTELQADCYAGVWAHHASVTPAPGTDTPFLKPLSDQDITDALSAASSVGDDRIQKAATGRVSPESWTHGSAAQRQHWFTVGYQTGDARRCDTYNARDLDNG
ncbi:KPN_02809 family neutral zinc metallopeptidase [Mycolicibacterium fallax]|uniref:Uncharacterized protein n=1 Tax=Mycolicibacterium fallax TaxID=1793 RepID=A0A1X1RH71_MYCFA|nr:neutral zinc metallopeptidase [Mycolicibacterium fallax]ORV06184.1 hypothetical protein AWC04_05810 [Mycolicibacterium fallax]BBY97084.1 membrane protein [Mycolicibacterium fallax]